jgi:uncharacterized protein YciI
MKQYVLVYLGGNHPTNQEEAKLHQMKYVEWLKSIEDVLVIPSIPLKDTNTVSSNGAIKEGSTCAMSGFTVMKADSMEDALAIAQACPFLEIGGSLEVSEMMQLTRQ